MAARLNNIQDAVEFIRLNKLEDFRAQRFLDKDNSTLFKSEAEKTIEENIDCFDRIMRMTEGSFYLIGGSSSRGKYQIEVKNDRRPETIRAEEPAQVSGIFGEEEIERRATNLFDQYKRDLENDEMREELKELRKVVERKETIVERFMEKIEPYIGAIVPALLGKILPATAPIAVAGVQNTANLNTESNMSNELTLTEDQENRIGNAIEKWMGCDPDCIALLEKIAHIAATNQAMYQMAKNILVSHNG